MLAKSLKKGDTIGIIAPSNPFTQSQKDLLIKAIKKFEDYGFNVVCSKNLFNVDKYGVSAGEPFERANDLNEMFANPKIDAIYCAQGGDTANQLLPLIDFKTIEQNPKIFLGMSDIDVLHLAITVKTNLTVFNSSDPKSGRAGKAMDLDINYTWNNFQDRLIHKLKELPASSERVCVRKGIAEGKIIGCNLSSILKLAGTQFFPNFKNSILFLEGYTEDTKSAVYKLEQLKHIGVFDKIKGIVIGYVVGFQAKEWIEKNDIKVNYEDVVLDMTKEYDFPILKTNDFGHYCPNCFLPIGANAKMDAENKSIEIIDEFLK